MNQKRRALRRPKYTDPVAPPKPGNPAIGLPAPFPALIFRFDPATHDWQASVDESLTAGAQESVA